MTNPLFDPPPIFDLPLVKGQDLIVNFKNKVPGSSPVEYEDYPDDMSVELIIDRKDDPVISTAVIDGFNAICRVESEVCDVLKAGILWRCRVNITGPPDDNLVAINGVTFRSDGKVEE